MKTIERKVDAPPAVVWDLWTTADGIEKWWAPDGFSTEVRKLDLRVGGELVHAMTAVDSAQIEFLESHGLPLTTEATKTFTEIEPPSRLGYTSLVDFVPGVEPYDHLTVIELIADGAGTKVVMQVEPLHDEEWTGRLIAGRTNELENLAAVVA